MNLENGESLPSLDREEFLPPVSPLTTAAGLLLAGGMGAALTLMTIIQYRDTVKVPALLRPQGELRVVQTAIAGTVTGIYARENQAVSAGDVIARLDDSRLQTQKHQLLEQERRAEAELDSVKAQMRALKSEEAAEIAKSSHIVAAAAAAFDKTRRRYEDGLLSARAEYRRAGARVRAAREDWRRAGLEVTEAEAELKSVAVALEAARSKSKRVAGAAREGALSRDQVEELEMAVTQQEQLLNAQTAKVEAYRRERERLREGIEISAAELETARIALRPEGAEIAISAERIAQNKAELKGTLATLNRQEKVLSQQQNELVGLLSQVRSSLLQIDRDLHGTRITATAAGMITKLHLRNPGQTLGAADEIAEIAPTGGRPVFKAVVPSRDINRVRPGQEVRLRVAACPYTDYGTLKGRVREIGGDSIEPRANTSYSVTIEPDELSLGGRDHPCPLKLGMEAGADIMGQEETVLKFLLRKMSVFK